RLVERLEQADPLAPADSRGLSELAESVAGRLQKIRKTFDDTVRQLADTAQPSQGREIEAALMVPLIPADLPGKLIIASPGITAKLNLGNERVGAAERSDAQLKQSAMNEGRLALATIGERAVEKLSTEADTFRRLRERVREPRDDWHADLLGAGA